MHPPPAEKTRRPPSSANDPLLFIPPAGQRRERRTGREKAMANAEGELSGWAGSTSFSPLPLGIGYTTGDTSKAPQTVERDEVFSYKRRRHMARQNKDDEREERMRMEILVDAYGPQEQA